MTAGIEKGFPGILLQIYAGSRTGELVVTAGDDLRRVTFVKGRPVTVFESRTSEPLGRVLLEMGIISQEHYDLSLIEMVKTGKLQGEILVEMGKITRDQLRLALDAQLRKKLNRLFFLKEFSYEFKEGGEQISSEGGLAGAPKVATLSVIYHGIKNSMKEAELNRALDLDRPAGIVLTGEYYAMAFSLPLSPEEVIIAEHLASPSSLASLLALGVLTRTEILMLLYYLSLLDLIEIDRSAAALDAVPTVPPIPADAAPPVTLTMDIEQTPVFATDLAPPPEAPPAGVQPAPKAPSGEYLSPKPPSGEVPALIDDPAAVTEMIARYAGIAQMDYYEILGVARGADETEVRRAYFDLMRRYHPANVSNENEEAVHIARILKIKANEAYTTLASPNLRAEYDMAMVQADGRQDQEGQRAGDAELEYHKGDFHLGRGDFKAALAAYRRALELGQEPDYVAAYGWALYNDPDQPREMREPMGKQYLRKAVVLSPNCCRAFIHLASIARLEGKIDEAEKYLAEAVKLDPDHDLAAPERVAITAARRAPHAPPRATQARRDKKSSGFFAKILGGGEDK